MQVAEINEQQSVARRKYAEYLKATKAGHSRELEAAKNGYREILRGNKVIDLVLSIQRAGVDALLRPRLAAIRADARVCYFRWYATRYSRHVNAPVFSMDNQFPRSKSRSIFLPPILPRFDRSARAVVPTIPPSLKPAKNLHKYVILWEAEWEDIPVDPMLLAPLGCNLYKVVAEWDLTPVEQSVLRGSLYE